MLCCSAFEHFLNFDKILHVQPFKFNWEWGGFSRNFFLVIWLIRPSKSHQFFYNTWKNLFKKKKKKKKNYFRFYKWSSLSHEKIHDWKRHYQTSQMFRKWGIILYWIRIWKWTFPYKIWNKLHGVWRFK